MSWGSDEVVLPGHIFCPFDTQNAILVLMEWMISDLWIHAASVNDIKKKWNMNVRLPNSYWSRLFDYTIFSLPGIFFYLWWCNLIHDRWGAWGINSGRRREWNCLKGAPFLLENWTYLRFWVLSPWKSQFFPFFQVPKNFFFHPEIPLKISCFFQHTNHIFLSTNSNSLFTNNTHKKWNIVP